MGPLRLAPLVVDQRVCLLYINQFEVSAVCNLFRVLFFTVSVSCFCVLCCFEFIRALNTHSWLMSGWLSWTYKLGERGTVNICSKLSVRTSRVCLAERRQSQWLTLAVLILSSAYMDTDNIGAGDVGAHWLDKRIIVPGRYPAINEFHENSVWTCPHAC